MARLAPTTRKGIVSKAKSVADSCCTRFLDIFNVICKVIVIYLVNEKEIIIIIFDSNPIKINVCVFVSQCVIWRSKKPIIRIKNRKIEYLKS